MTWTRFSARTGSPRDGGDFGEELQRAAGCSQEDQLACTDPARLGAGHQDDVLSRAVLGEGGARVRLRGRLVEDTVSSRRERDPQQRMAVAMRRLLDRRRREALPLWADQFLCPADDARVR